MTDSMGGMSGSLHGWHVGLSTWVVCRAIYMGGMLG